MGDDASEKVGAWYGMWKECGGGLGIVMNARVGCLLVGGVMWV